MINSIDLSKKMSIFNEYLDKDLKSSCYFRKKILE